jgi:hypothetical protein
LLCPTSRALCQELGHSLMPPPAIVGIMQRVKASFVADFGLASECRKPASYRSNLQNYSHYEIDQ